MAKVLVSETAHADTLSLIRELSEKAGVSVAASYAADFDRLYGRLAVFPESGAPRVALGPNVRCCVVFPYVVLYNYVDAHDAVTILRILHGRRRITRRLLTGA